MSLESLLNALRHRLAPRRGGQAQVRLQYLGMSDADLQALRPLLDGVARHLGLTLALDAGAGDIVVVERGFASHVSRQVLQAYCEDRPMVAIDVSEATGHPLEVMLERFEERQQDLLRQLREIPLVRQRASRWGTLDGPQADARTEPSAAVRRGSGQPTLFESGFDPSFDSRLDEEDLPALIAGHRQLVDNMLRGLADPTQPRLWLGYGPGACLEVDFEAALVRMDPAAEQQLRIAGELPSRAPPGAVPGPRAVERALDQTVWDLGLACGGYRLLRQPHDWWHVPLVAGGEMALERYSRMPRHLALARRLQRGPATPSALRRHALISVNELRAFVQACLFLGLLDWDDAPAR
ncbi:MAG: hypothetical protein OEU93_13030 [Rubrivivax sp.]|nr:hypothetical protein [Rubrivivax sp.]MDH5338743.1 hypothetical protein [Rubrivivax sp.]